MPLARRASDVSGRGQRSERLTLMSSRSQVATGIVVLLTADEHTCFQVDSFWALEEMEFAMYAVPQVSIAESEWRLGPTSTTATRRS